MFDIKLLKELKLYSEWKNPKIFSYYSDFYRMVERFTNYSFDANYGHNSYYISNNNRKNPQILVKMLIKCLIESAINVLFNLDFK